MTSLLLDHRAFRRFALAFLISRAGDFMLSVGMVVFVFSRTGSAGWVAAAATLRLVPHILLSSFGGSLGDRFGQRFLVASDIVRATLNVALTASALAGSLPAVIALSVLTQVAGAGYGATSVGLVPRLVEDGESAAANSALGAIESLSLLAGPCLAGVLMAVASPALAFGLNAASFVLSAFAVASLRLRPSAFDAEFAQGDQLGGTQIVRRRGWAYRELVRQPELRAATLGVVGANVVVGAVSVLFVVVSVENLGIGAAGTGFLLGAFGAGGVVGALAAGRWMGRAATRRWAAVMLAATGLATASLSHARLLPIALLLSAAMGAATSFLEIVSVTQVQKDAGANAAAVCGAMDSLCYAAVLVGLVVSPLLVEAFGGAGCLVAIGGGLLGLAGWASLGDNSDCFQEGRGWRRDRIRWSRYGNDYRTGLGSVPGRQQAPRPGCRGSGPRRGGQPRAVRPATLRLSPRPCPVHVPDHHCRQREH